MKQWVDFVARLYPRAWRDRYGAEFDALLQDVKPGWREVLDVLGGALAMQLTDASTYLKFGIAFAVAGAIAGSFGTSREYTSTAALRITPLQMPETGRLTVDIEPIAQVEQLVLSRSSLSSVIQNPSLNLYRKERESQPLEHVIDKMRSQDIHVNIESDGGRPTTMRVSFQYPDREKAQATEKVLVQKFEEAFERQRELNDRLPQAVPIHQILEVLDRPHVSTVTTNRWLVVGKSLLGGLALGLVVAIFWKQPRRALIVGSLGLAGCVFGVALAFLPPQSYESHAALRIVTWDRLAGTLEGRQWLQKIAEKVHEPDLRIRVADHGTTVELALVSTDPRMAQAKLVAVEKRFLEFSHEDIQTSGRPGFELRGWVVEYLDHASLPITPIGPNRFQWGAMIGLGAGLVSSGFWFRGRRFRLGTR